MTHNAHAVATTVAGRIIGAQAICACGYAGEHRANHIIARDDADQHRITRQREQRARRNTARPTRQETR